MRIKKILAVFIEGLMCMNTFVSFVSIMVSNLLLISVLCINNTFRVNKETTNGINASKLRRQC